ncbi:MAG: P-II family nitrogen regulator [Candidatus Hydrogenedentes bacterium]|nr:P-II family nitrogen regulator [Candidatus Hydrogenedentota bacterium]
MKEIKVFIRPELLEDVLEPLYAHPEFPGVTISDVRGFGHKVGRRNRGELGEVRMIKLETIVPDALLEDVLGVIQEQAHTGRNGDGKIAIYDVREVIRISSGERIVE